MFWDEDCVRRSLEDTPIFSVTQGWFVNQNSQEGMHLLAFSINRRLVSSFDISLKFQYRSFSRKLTKLQHKVGDDSSYRIGL